MTVKSLKYSEFENTDKEWVLSKVDIHSIAMLVVGKNATGKSRFLNILKSLADCIAGKRPPAMGDFDIKISLNEEDYWYQLSVGADGNVIREVLVVNNEMVLERNSNTPTQLLYVKERRYIDTELPGQVLAVQSRQDIAQHPWFVTLVKWASLVSHFSFATGFTQSQSQLASFDAVLRMTSDIPSPKANAIKNPFEDVIATYVQAFHNHKEKFDQAVIKDMKSIGFYLTDVGVEHVNALMPNLQMNLASLFMEEKGVKSKIPQLQISQGMFRSLALVISLNAIAMSGEKRLVLIDDIGEGLDYERAKALVQLLLKKTKGKNLQVIMSTNDRYIMNGVPLDQWCVLHRVKSKVTSFTSVTHKELFKDFSFVGLSNFDFFSRDFYLKNSK